MPTGSTDLWARFRAAVVAERDRRGWTQDDLAARARIARPTLSRIESGQTASPDRATVEALAKALELEVDVLFAGGPQVDHPPLDEMHLAMARERLPKAPPDVLARYVRLIHQAQRVNVELDELRSRYGPNGVGP